MKFFSNSKVHHFFIFCIFLNIQVVWATRISVDICSDYSVQYIDKQAKPESEDIPYGTGLLWKIEKDGVANYLFGTMHSQDRRVTLLPSQVLLALVQSKTLVMEIIQNKEANNVFIDSMYFNNKQIISDLIDTSIYEKLKKIIVPYGINTNDTPRLKPWAAFSILAQPRPVRALTLDQVLMNQAISVNNKIVGLETMGELVASLENIPVEDQIEILNDTVCNHEQIISDAQKLVLLYVARDLAGIINFNNQPHHDEEVFKRYINIMINDRNLRMIDRMGPYLEQGSAFIAVGALHLAGNKGLLKLLEQRGYNISVIY